MTATKTIRERIETATELFDFDSRAEVDRDDVLQFILDRQASVGESEWRDDDAGWPAENREGREVVVLTPTKGGYLQPLQEWVIVIG